MKKLIEVIEKDNNEIIFRTDLKSTDIVDLQTLAGKLAYNMMTRLWGGNEQFVLAVIRNLAIADLAVSVNRKEMISFLDEASEVTAMLIQETFEHMRKKGYDVRQYAPGVKPPKKSN